MKQFSIVAWTDREVLMVDPDIYFEPGVNAVTVFTDNIDEVRNQLVARGVRVDQINPIEVPPTPAAPRGQPVLETDGLLGTKSIS